MDSLPGEVVAKILSQLCSRDLAHAALASKQLHDHSHDVSSLDIVIQRSARHVESLIRWLHQATQVCRRLSLCMQLIMPRLWSSVCMI